MIEKIADIVEREMADNNVPGISIGVWKDGLLEASGFGVANVESQLNVDAETLFQIGSISKIFTATLAMTLVDEGMLDLDSPVVDYLPELTLKDSGAQTKIKVRHLMTHTSGINGDRFDDHGDGDDALARAVAAMSDLDQQTDPGELWSYCNSGWDILGRTIEVILGMPFESAMRARVFAPLGLKLTTYFAKDAIRHPVAVGHESPPDGSMSVADPWSIPRRSNPAGGISSNIPELLRFARMHMNNGLIDDVQLLSEQSARSIRTAQVEAAYGRQWGLGWALRQVGSEQIVEHNGATNGFMALLTTIPEQEFAIAILTNSDHGSLLHAAVSAAILKEAFGISEPEPERIELNSEDLESFTGKFSRLLVDFEIFLSNGQLMMSRVDHEPFSGKDVAFEPIRVNPISSDKLVVEEGDLAGMIGEYFFNDDGTVRFVRSGGRLAYRKGR